MRLSLYLIALSLSASTAHASWFGSDEPPTPSQWTADQYASAQKTFNNLKESSFDTWSDSRLREFLLEQGVIEPASTREALLLQAKQQYKAYTNAASTFASTVSSKASSAIYGDPTYQASWSMSSFAAAATKEANKQLDATKDYVYSTWEDNQLRDYLVSKGVIKSKEQKTREEYLALMKNAYLSTTDPVWKAWSDSYIRGWLLSHGLVKTDYEKKRDALLADMNKYYYSTTDSVYSTWSDSQLKEWLVANNVIKSDSQAKRDKLIKLVEDNYAHASSTIWSSWSDSDMRAWLIQNGYMKSDAQAKRDELVKSMNEKYTATTDNFKPTPYLTWPDARLRAYLRERGLSESALPTERPGLLQEVRIRYIQSQYKTEALYNKLRDIVNGGVEAAEEKLALIYETLLGTADEGKKYGEEKYAEGKGYAEGKYAEGKGYAEGKYSEGKGYAQGKYADSKENVGEGVKKTGQKIKGEL